jgi:hypothetical protein
MSLKFLSVVAGNPQSYTGCEYHRQIVPHVALNRTYPVDIYQVDSLDNTKRLNVNGEMISMDELIGMVDFVHFGRIIDSVTAEEYANAYFQTGTSPHAFRVQQIADRIHKLGKPIIMDLDDYWNLSKQHLLKETFRQNRQDWEIAKSVKIADYITVTTPFLADRVRPHNNNITILPNAIDPDFDSSVVSEMLTPFRQWQQKEIPDKFGRLRFGWIGGSCHEEDFDIMRTSIGKIWHDRDLQGKFQIVLGGFNVSDGFFHKDDKGNITHKKVPSPHCVYAKYERMLTDGFSHIKTEHPNYYTYLMQYGPEGNDFSNEYRIPYKREWAVDTYTYGEKYNHWDVTLIPLNDNEFNNSKSQLKMIESGFMGKACIVSGVLPYTYDAKHMTNAYVIPPNKNHKWWNKAIREMINDREMVKELSANLEREMKEKYHIEKINETRWELFCRVSGKPELVTARKEKLQAA